MLPDARGRRPNLRAHALAACFLAAAATSAFAAGRAGDKPHGLLVGVFGGPGPSISGYELPSAKRVALRQGDKGGYPVFASLSPDGAKLHSHIGRRLPVRLTSCESASATARESGR
jgi:hypothetical protein